MLAELRISALGVIETAVLPLGPGLTVVTGETGAGKTMVVHSLGLLLGGKADPGLVRVGASRAVVEGRLRGAPAAALERAAEAGAELDDGELIAGRSVGTEGGRSRAWVGGVGVPAATLGDITAAAIVVHGQHDQQRFVRPVEQRQALDRYAGPELAVALDRYQAVYDGWRAASAELADLRQRALAREQEGDLLRAGLERVEAAAPEPGEDVALRARAERLRNAGDLQAAAARAAAALTGDDAGDAAWSVVALCEDARRSLEAAAAYDPALTAFAQRAREVGLLAADLAADLSSYSTSVESDPAALAAVEDRRAALSALTRQHGPDVDALLTWAAEAARRLDALAVSDERAESLAGEVARADAELDQLAAAVSQLRRRAAGELGAAIDAELAGLAMGGASITVGVTAGRRGRHGTDDVEVLLTPSPGSPARPLGRGASGGELSRVMLAVEVVLAGVGEAATLVFDEVDAGVGGRAAVEIGRRLARLACTHQVICVTHLAQVAAYADAHLRVARGSTAAGGGITATDIEDLDDAARVLELSRMLGGLETSDLAQGHARELLDRAAASKTGSPPK